jgi:sugar lactone lactonase YvrE
MLLSITVIGLLAQVLMAQVGTVVNSVPNPYRTIDNWATLPQGMTMGQAAGVDVDRDGNIWVAQRCGSNTCNGRNDAPILHFDPSGKLIRSFGSGMFVFPHGVFADPDGNVWVTDALGTEGKGHQIFKFTPTGQVLMTLGKPGAGTGGTDTLNRPSDVIVGRNGDIFVADGHGGNAVSRIVKFSSEGKFLKAWGKTGSGRGEFNVPHALALDSSGRLFVADRMNNRIQIFDQEGSFLEEWTQFGRPSGLHITADDTIYVSDSESDASRHPGWKRGIRVGSAKDGIVRAFIPDPIPVAGPESTSGEGVAADKSGNIYAVELTPPGIKKHIR